MSIQEQATFYKPTHNYIILQNNMSNFIDSSKWKMIFTFILLNI